MSVLQFILITIVFYLSEANDTRRMFSNKQSEVQQSEEDSFTAPLILVPTLS